jgi:hypothetical protein
MRGSLERLKAHGPSSPYLMLAHVLNSPFGPFRRTRGRGAMWLQEGLQGAKLPSAAFVIDNPEASTICWAIHSAVGNGVIPTCRISRFTCRITKKT